MKQHLLLLVTLGGAAVACGGAQTVPPSSPTTTSAQVAPQKPAEAETPAAAAEAPPPAADAPAEAAPEPEKTAMPEPCDGSWVCVSVSPKNKIDKRLSQLIGDPAIESTESGMIDDARGATKLSLDGKTYEFVLRRVPGAGSQIVLRGGGVAGEVILDKHKPNDFTYVGVIATKGKDGSLLVDIRYMK